jgi:zinc protease
VEAGLEAVIAEVAAEGPTEEELARIKKKARASWIYAQDSQSSLARRYGQALAVGLTVEDVEAWPGVLDAITAAEVRDAAARYLVEERAVTGWLERDVEEQG